MSSQEQDRAVGAVAEKVAAGLGFAPDELAEIPGGVANRVFRLGVGLMVRVPRAAGFEADLRKELEVIPLARRQGVRTPAVVDTGSVDGTPYVVMERVEGNDLVGQGTTAAWTEVGREIALLHQLEQQVLPGVPQDSGGDGRAVEELVERGYLDAGTGQWLGGWLEELGDRFDRHAAPVLLHGDLGVQNVLVDDAGRFAALIDWGDAAWGPRGMEFAKLRLEDVVRVLPAYKEVVEVPFAPGELEAAVLWFHLQWGLSNLTGPPRPHQRHWTAPPASRVLGVLRFVAAGPPEPWDTVIKKVDRWH